MFTGIFMVLSFVTQANTVRVDGVNNRSVTYHGNTVSYSSNTIAQYAYMNLNKSQRIRTQTVQAYQPARFTAEDYVRNPILSDSPRVKQAMAQVPQMIDNDATNGLSRFQQRQMQEQLQAIQNSLPPLEKWQPSKVKPKKKVKK